MALSRPTLHHAATYSAAPPTPTVVPTEQSTPVSTPRHSMAVARPRSDPSLRQRSKSIDLNLAYGNIPPDLASRVDLDVDHAPALTEPEEEKEAEARTLMDRIEAILDEAHCIQHTATSIITKLQDNPESAAAVALTLAELSALLAKMSPAFLGVVKGGFPAIFALLASPQFLIGTSIAVGVTVVMFGGWKIIKRIREAKAREDDKQAFEMQEQAGAPGEGRGGNGASGGGGAAAGELPTVPTGPVGAAGSVDEALVLDDELSTIETWRRGIVPFGDDESTADVELISPEAMRSRIGDYDERTLRSVRTHRTSRSHRSHHSSRSHRSRHGRNGAADDDDDEHEVPERKSSKGFSGKERDRDGESEAGSHRSGGHRGGSRSKRTERVDVKAIEDGSRREDDSLDGVLRPKEKKNNMLKQLFKKKNKDDNGRSEMSVSVLV